MTAVLTERQRVVLRAALTYAYANCDDLNDAFYDELAADGAEVIYLDGGPVAPITEEEFNGLAEVLLDQPL